ncbi:mitochondrial cardiolipin hydrolase-like [Aricia agestis]|uniref:mitochondrial cardiolipin hydrolase-like n=1 Tax=Aricia agestis TaxID=91739 RepID=UPI001C202CF0|nr:mitochondrial cardiolipin hydrolase-like [Aricia agestis]
MVFKYKSVSVLILASMAFTTLVYEYYRKRKQPQITKKKETEIHEVIMFSPNDVQLKKSKYSRCAITTSMDRILYYLSSPKHNLDICMYVLTNMDLAHAIIKLTYRRINVRVIMDADMAFSQGSALKRLESHNIPVRWMKSTNLMHHKFCLIDTMDESGLTTPVAISGSLNWTNQALSGNWEDVIVTSQPSIVQQYKNEFEKLWTQFKPIGL